MSNDTADISEYTQQVTVFRYFVGNTVKEKFWRFCNAESQDAEVLSKVNIEQLQIVLKVNTEKMITEATMEQP